MTALARFVLRHKRLVAVFWTVAALAGLVGSGRASEALESSFSMPESEAFATNQEIERLFGSGGTTPTLVAVVRLPEGRMVASDGVRGDLRALERRLLERTQVAAHAVTRNGPPLGQAHDRDEGRGRAAGAEQPLDLLVGRERLALGHGEARLERLGRAAGADEPGERGYGPEDGDEALVPEDEAGERGHRLPSRSRRLRSSASSCSTAAAVRAWAASDSSASFRYSVSRAPTMRVRQVASSCQTATTITLPTSAMPAIAIAASGQLSCAS